MPLTPTTGWRIVQLLSIFWCIFMACSVVLLTYSTIYDNKQMLHLFLDVIERDKAFFQPKTSSKVEIETAYNYVGIVLKGSIAVIVIGVLLSIATSYAILIEKRWVSILFAVFNAILCIDALIFGILSFAGKPMTTLLVRSMLKYGVNRYSWLNESKTRDVHIGDGWRFVIDQLQMQGKCCGSEGPGDYLNKFVNIDVWIWPDKISTIGHRSACICNETNSGQCFQQIVPYSCCQETSAANPFCAVNRSAPCGMRLTPTDVQFKESVQMDGCVDKVQDMNFLTSLYYHGAVDLIVFLLTCVLAIMLVLMARKTASRGTMVKEDVRAAFNVDSLQAGKMVDDAAKESSMSLSHDSRRQNVSIMSRDGPQRVSSDRLAPQSLSMRPPSSANRSGKPSKKPSKSGSRSKEKK